MVHYASDPDVNHCITKLVAIFARSPYDFDAEYGDKTIEVVLETVRAYYGDIARFAKITIH